jgi:hypothetical protein
MRMVVEGWLASWLVGWLDDWTAGARKLPGEEEEIESRRVQSAGLKWRLLYQLVTMPKWKP